MVSAVTVLIDDNLSADEQSWLFEEPVEIVRCEAPEQVPAALTRVEAACRRGLYAAGFLSYELGYVLEPRLQPLLPEDRTQPLMWMGLFDRGERLGRREVDHWLAGKTRGACALETIASSMTREQYLEAFARVQNYIADGDVYQVNLTLKQRFHMQGCPIALYRRLRRRQPVAHGGLVQAPDFHVLSLSPELFLTVRGDHATMRPMKGTAPRGDTAASDRRHRLQLQGDIKNRAENLMIVDLMRNDLGRVARIGSVRVSDLFSVETYPTLHQMCTTVSARLRSGSGFDELIRRLFPCGSITGAPKIRAMEIIRELEGQPRGVYTGSLGFLAPDGRMRFNVAIRTLYVDSGGGTEMGIGSGIVADSDAQAEYDECLLKAQFLQGVAADVPVD